MDQTPFFCLDDTESAQQIDLQETPLSAEHYLRQVMHERKSACADVVIGVTEEDVQQHATKQTVFVKERTFSQYLTLGVASSSKTTQSIHASAPPLPTRAWIDRQVVDFNALRDAFFRRRNREQRSSSFGSFVFPDEDNEHAWDIFCFKQWTCQLPKTGLRLWDNETETSLIACHTGTPPLQRLMLNMPAYLVPCVLQFQVEWFRSRPFSDAAAHWLFALLVALEKPVDGDTVAALRDLIRFCGRSRALCTVAEWAQALDPPDQDIARIERVFTYLMVVVAFCFDQGDLKQVIFDCVDSEEPIAGSSVRVEEKMT